MSDLRRIDYDAILANAPAASDPRAFLASELPNHWFAVYKSMTPHRVNVHHLTGDDGVEYLFDFVDEFVEAGLLDTRHAAPSRLIAAQCRSRPPTGVRDAVRMKPFPLGAVVMEEASGLSRYDRGHMIAHRSGGGLDVNLVPQLRSLNQGRSEQGKRFRDMERYCATWPGTYCFSRLVYTTLTDHPRWIELGLLEQGNRLRVELFDNVENDGEMTEIERVFRARVNEVVGKARDT